MPAFDQHHQTVGGKQVNRDMQEGHQENAIFDQSHQNVWGDQENIAGGQNLASRPQSWSKPITILFLAADPQRTSKLRLDEEVRAIDASLLRSPFRDRFDLRPR